MNSKYSRDYDYDMYIEQFKFENYHEEIKMKKNMHDLFKIGDEIYGYCDGWFGREDYKDKKCVYITKHYAIFEYDDGSATILNYGDQLELYYSAEWKDPKNSYYEEV